MTQSNLIRSYVVAVLAAVAAALLRWALTPIVGETPPFLTFLVAVAVVTRYEGFAAGLVTTALSVPLAAVLFLAGPVGYRTPTAVDFRRAIFFVLVSWLIVTITARLRSLRQAASAEATRLRMVLQSIGDGVIVSDAAGVVQMVNPEAERITGWTTNDVQGAALASVFTIVDEDTRRVRENPALRAVLDNTTVRLDAPTLLVARDGDERPIEVVAAPLHDDSDGVTGSVLVFRDESERRRSEGALRTSEQELADFFEHATIGLHWTGPDGIILRANQAELDMLGYPENEYIGRHLSEFHDDQTALAGLLARLAAGDTVRDFPARLRCRDGRLKEVVINASVRTHQGRVVHIRSFTIDVTDRKRADEATAHLAAIVESSNDAVLSKTLDGRILTWNAGAEAMFGYTAAEAVGRSVDLIVPDDMRAVEQELLARVAGGGGVKSFETTRLARNGERLDVSLTISPIRNEAGVITGASSIARDIRSQKRLEQSLREADRRKDEFLAVLAHELRNPLAPIRNSVATMRLAASDDPTIRHATDVIDRQSRQMARLLDDLMDVSRITRGKLDLRRAPVTLQSVLDLALETTGPLLESAGQTLTVSMPPEPVPLDADSMRLAQVFSNLVSNASKYSNRGSAIRLTATRAGSAVVVTVADDGIGIPADALPSIFEMFSQASQALDHAQGGLGIGLSIVRGLVDLHGGHVSAASAGPGRGSTFEVHLPVAGATTGEAAPAAADPAVGPRCRIVIADDNRDSADSLALVLRAQGHDVATAYDGATAVREVSAFRPDIVLLDLGMPLVSGFEAARQIRATPEGKGMMLVAVTGWGQQTYREQTRDAGFDAHLVKPVDFEHLQRMMLTRMQG